MLYHIAFTFMACMEDAEDLAMEAFVRAMCKFDPGRGYFVPYVCTILENLCKDELKSPWHERREEFDQEGLEDPLEQIPDETYLPEKIVITEELCKEVRKAIEKLPPHQREVVLLFHVEEKSMEEIAQLVGRPLGTVKSRLNRGRELLKKLLSYYWKEG
jgi:RNA polymerase sigma-70 factor (ECF subfamily)